MAPNSRVSAAFLEESESERLRWTKCFGMRHRIYRQKRPCRWPASTIAVLGFFAATAGRSDEPQNDGVTFGTLEVTVTGFDTEDGRLAIALFASEHDYSNQINAVRRAWLSIENGESRWTIENLAEGDYALIAFQDLNGNEQIDMRVLGMPREPVAVSNDARGLFGPPRFEVAKFEFAAPLTRHAMKLR